MQLHMDLRCWLFFSRMGGANDAAQHSRYVNARDSCSSAGDRPLCSWIDMERPSFSKAISHGQGAALFSLGNASLTGSGILCVVRRATQGKLRARVRQERGDRGRLPRRADRNGRTSWAAKLSTNVNGVGIKKKPPEGSGGWFDLRHRV